MNKAIENTGNLKIDIITHHSDSESIPKQLQILDVDLKVKDSVWVEDRIWNHELQPGTYLVRLNLASGKQMEEIAEISGGHETKLDFNIGQFSPRESQEWAYLTKGTVGENFIERVSSINKAIRPGVKPNVEITANRWKYVGNEWSSEPETAIDYRLIDQVGRSYQLNVPNGMQLLEIRIEGKLSTFVCLPPSYSLDCMIRIAEGPETIVGDLDISLGTDNKTAQVLISLMTSGDMAKGKSLFSVEDAERLLLQKWVDPMAAAIGGYFLLKTGELDRMRDWGNNLANWFTWMPDGAVIHGWQLIREGANADTIKIIRKRFIEAVNRGIPIYTEGLRLLYEGLMMLSFEFKHEDEATEKALARVRKYRSAADLSQENTTFMGSYPDLPGDTILLTESAGKVRSVEKINPN